MAYKLRSGNKTSFKNMGSSPAKHRVTEVTGEGVNKRTVDNPHEHKDGRAYYPPRKGDKTGSYSIDKPKEDKKAKDGEKKSPAKKAGIFEGEGEDRVRISKTEAAKKEAKGVKITRTAKDNPNKAEGKEQIKKLGKNLANYDKNLQISKTTGHYKDETLLGWDSEGNAITTKDVEKNIREKEKSPAKTHKPGHKKGVSVSDFDDTVAYTKKKEQLLNQGFTQKDADQMIKSGATTGEVDKKPENPKYEKTEIKESYKGRMKRLSKKYKKSPKEINKTLKSKDYKEGRKSM